MGEPRHDATINALYRLALALSARVIGRRGMVYALCALCGEQCPPPSSTPSTTEKEEWLGVHADDCPMFQLLERVNAMPMGVGVKGGCKHRWQEYCLWIAPPGSPEPYWWNNRCGREAGPGCGADCGAYAALSGEEVDGG